MGGHGRLPNWFAAIKAPIRRSGQIVVAACHTPPVSPPNHRNRRPIGNIPSPLTQSFRFSGSNWLPDRCGR